MKVIPFAKYYRITTQGDVYSKKSPDKKMIPIVMKCGYLRLKLKCDDGITKSFLVHRLVALTFLSNPQNKKFVNHLNGIKTDNRLENLEWCTARENQLHAYQTGLKSSSGENNSRNILKEDQVIEIYYKLMNGARVCDIAKEYNLSTSSVNSIKSKSNWNYLLKDLPDITRLKNKEKLSESTVRWVCQKLQMGVGPKEILQISTNKNLTIDNIYDIKRRRNFKHIVCDYKW